VAVGGTRARSISADRSNRLARDRLARFLPIFPRRVSRWFRALGYLEGQNLIIEYRWGKGEVDRLPALAAELVEQKVDVILAGATIGARAAKTATREVPIVAAGAGDLVA
jgi:hypothetical protein